MPVACFLGRGRVHQITDAFHFDTNCIFIKDNTPFEMTFVVTYCNGHECYIPSQLGFDNGCYEKDNGFFVAGTGEKLADTYVEALKELHG